MSVPPSRPTVEEVLEQTKLLSLEERVTLLEMLRAELVQQVTIMQQHIESQQHSISELEGLGKEL